MNLNRRCDKLVSRLDADQGESLRVKIFRHGADNAKLVDCGVTATGGIGAGLLMARVCSAFLGNIWLTTSSEHSMPIVMFGSDHPVLACLAAQYAGWEIKGENYFAMGSGPMRAAAAREPLFAEIGRHEKADRCYGILESSKIPPAEVCREIADKCGVTPANLTLLVAPTRSMAGTLQIVARSVETAMHKLHELKFDLERVLSGFGSAPLPPPAPNDLVAIGRTNDAILYGGRVTLYVRGEDASLEAIGPQVPSNASRDYGRPFAETLAAYNHDFYRVDPLLFSPAEITLVNLDTGNSFRFGQLNPELLVQSFGESAG